MNTILLQLKIHLKFMSILALQNPQKTKNGKN